MLIVSYAAKMLEHEGLDDIIAAIDPLLSDTDKYKQRAGAEILGGILRGLCIRRNFIGYNDQ